MQPRAPAEKHRSARGRVLPCAALSAALAACGTVPDSPPRPPPAVGSSAPASVPATNVAAAPVALAAEPGLYRCELDRRVTVRRIAPDGRQLVLAWLGADHTLQRTPARTGAARYESSQDGLTWLVIDGKSMLLDSKRGRQLANECRL